MRSFHGKEKVVSSIMHPVNQRPEEPPNCKGTKLNEVKHDIEKLNAIREG
jgi:hypothetical protein